MGRQRTYTHRWTWPKGVERDQVVQATCVDTGEMLQGPLNVVLRRALADIELGHTISIRSIERGGRTEASTLVVPGGTESSHG